MANQVRNAIAIGEFVESLAGKMVRIAEAISWRPGTDFERHSTVHNQFSFSVDNTMWTMSGGHFVLMGGSDTSYSIGTRKLFSVDISAGEAVIIERYGEQAERRSHIRILASM